MKEQTDPYQEFFNCVTNLFVEGVEFMTKLQIYDAIKKEWQKNIEGGFNMKRPKLSVKVHNMTEKSRSVPNQFVIETSEGNFFQSYETIVAFWPKDGRILLDKNNWDYSVTTGKYRNQFLGEDKKTTLAKIKSGEYRLVNLNETDTI